MQEAETDSTLLEGSGRFPFALLQRLLAESLLLMVPLVLSGITADIFGPPKQMTLRVCALCLWAAGIAESHRSRTMATFPAALPLLSLALAFLLSTIWSVSPGVAWIGETGTWCGCSGLFSILGAAVGWKLWGGGSPRRLACLVLVGAVASLAYTVFVRLGGGDFQWDPVTQQSYWIESPFGNPTSYGHFLAAAILLSLVPAFGGCRWLAWTLRAALLSFLLMTGSRSALVGLLAGIGVWWGQRSRQPCGQEGIRRTLPAIAVGVLGAAVLATVLDRAAVLRFIPNGDLLGSRPGVWRSAGRMWRSSPWVGVGPDLFISRFRAFSAPGDYAHSPQAYGRSTLLVTPASAHNEALQVGATTGLIGLGAFLWILAVAVRWGRASPLLPSLVSIGVGLMVSPVGSAVSFVFWVLVVQMAASPTRHAVGRLWRVIPLAVVVVLGVSAWDFTKVFVDLAQTREVGHLLSKSEDLAGGSCLLNWTERRVAHHPDVDYENALYLEAIRHSGLFPVDLLARSSSLMQRAVQVDRGNALYTDTLAKFEIIAFKATGDRHHLLVAEQAARSTVAIMPSFSLSYDALVEVLTLLGRAEEATRFRELRDYQRAPRP